MAMLLYLIGVLSIIGGGVLGFLTWENSWLLSIGWVIAGIIEGIVFFALAKILDGVGDLTQTLSYMQTSIRSGFSKIEELSNKN